MLTPNLRMDPLVFESFQPFNLSYRETALWGTYFVGDRMKLEPGLESILHEWRHLCKAVTNNELQKGKNALLTKLISEREGNINNANSIASDILRFGRRVTLEEWQTKINQVDKYKVHQVAENYIWDRCPAISALGPVEQLSTYDFLRMYMSSYIW